MGRPVSQSTTHAACLTALESLFPTADPGFLLSAVDHELKQQRRQASSGPPDRSLAPDALVKRVIEGVVHKLLELNHGQYPRVVRVGESASDSRARDSRPERMTSRLDDVVGARESTGAVDETMTRNMAL